MSDELQERIREHFSKIQESIRTGNVVLILGPNTRSGSTNKLGKKTPNHKEFFSLCNSELEFHPSDIEEIEHDDIVDLAIVDDVKRRRYFSMLEESFLIRRTSNSVKFIPQFVWHRIYTFDLSNNLEVAYRQDSYRRQGLTATTVDQPIDAERQFSEKLSLIKLFGSVSHEIDRTFLSLPQFEQILGASPWIRSLAHDIDRYPVIFLGSVGDGKFLISKLRQVRSLSSSYQNVTFVAPDLNDAQSRILEQIGIVHLPLPIDVFGTSLTEVFPQGVSIANIAELSSPDISGKNAELSASILSEFEILDRPRIEKLSVSPEKEGQIRRFYRGDEPIWADINENVHADLMSYENFRGRIENQLKSGFPNRKLFLLVSPAGLGKSVGLMATALWLRDRVTQPILWLQSGGDLKRFFVNLQADDFADGLYLFVDDITLFKDEFEFVLGEKLNQICVVGTSRETRWNFHQGAFEGKVDVVRQDMRSLNKNDASKLYNKIERYGTVLHFAAKSADDRISEILGKSQRDLLVLIKEIGLGEKFNKIVQSEIDDLDEMQKFVYLAICVPDRIQTSMPLDLIANSFRKKFSSQDFGNVMKSMGKLLRVNRNGTSISTRHSVIAARIVESYKGHYRIDEIRSSIEGVLSAFEDYRRPVMVHHSNTGHARVFKALINSKFLFFLFGPDAALEIYRKFEKAFEVDGFFWQHFGLTYLRSGDFDRAIETLTHAAQTHDHVQIRHSLASARLQLCLKRGPKNLGQMRFDEIRDQALEELDLLHHERGNQEDIAIATLATMDSRISQLYDSDVDCNARLRKYHTNLALYLRQFPSMAKASEAYNRLNEILIKQEEDESDVDIEKFLSDEN